MNIYCFCQCCGAEIILFRLRLYFFYFFWLRHQLQPYRYTVLPLENQFSLASSTLTAQILAPVPDLKIVTIPPCLALQHWFLCLSVHLFVYHSNNIWFTFGFYRILDYGSRIRIPQHEKLNPDPKKLYICIQKIRKPNRNRRHLNLLQKNV